MVWTDLATPLRRLAPLTVVALLAACSVTGPRESPLPKYGPNLVEVYRDHIATQGASGQSPRERLPLRSPDEDESAMLRRTDFLPVQQSFQRLPNPDLVMHVFAHLARGRYPVPAYVTVFPMYETVEYAMPGEVFERAPLPSALPKTTAVAAPVSPVASTPKMEAAKEATFRNTECRGEGACSRN